MEHETVSFKKRGKKPEIQKIKNSGTTQYQKIQCLFNKKRKTFLGIHSKYQQKNNVIV